MLWIFFLLILTLENTMGIFFAIQHNTEKIIYANNSGDAIEGRVCWVLKLVLLGFEVWVCWVLFAWFVLSLSLS